MRATDFDFVEIAHAQLTESELSSVFAYPRFLRVLASRWFLDKPSDKGLNQKVAETDDFLTLKVSRDTA